MVTSEMPSFVISSVSGFQRLTITLKRKTNYGLVCTWTLCTCTIKGRPGILVVNNIAQYLSTYSVITYWRNEAWKKISAWCNHQTHQKSQIMLMTHFLFLEEMKEPSSRSWLTIPVDSTTWMRTHYVSLIDSYDKVGIIHKLQDTSAFLTSERLLVKLLFRSS